MVKDPFWNGTICVYALKPSRSTERKMKLIMLGGAYAVSDSCCCARFCRYQEILTDPSYAGQFVLMTNPHIGNTGVNFGRQHSCYQIFCVFFHLNLM